jgi:hypothetical protein
MFLLFETSLFQSVVPREVKVPPVQAPLVGFGYNTSLGLENPIKRTTIKDEKSKGMGTSCQKIRFQTQL